MNTIELLEAFKEKKTLFTILHKIVEVYITELEFVLIDTSETMPVEVIRKIVVEIKREDNFTFLKSFEIVPSRLFASIESLKEFYNL